MKKINKILVIIQRSNGDVLLSYSLIQQLYKYYEFPKIDLLVNDDTYQVAKIFPEVNNVHQFSYALKQKSRWRQEKKIFQSIFQKYDLSINLTASDRSVIYALISSNKSISAIEKDNRKSWWKKLFLSDYYLFNSNHHILLNNLMSLKLLNINHVLEQTLPKIHSKNMDRISRRFNLKSMGEFIIFHPSAQYEYKIFPSNLRHELLQKLSTTGVTILITGSSNKIDTRIKNEIGDFPNIINLIGRTSLEDFIVLSQLSIAYIGMDTLNMHIAAAQSKRIFAIFGPTNLSMWSPWSNQLKKSAQEDKPIQTYSNITLFQADMPCVACGKAGCNNKGISDCLSNIEPSIIYKEFNQWYQSYIN